MRRWLQRGMRDEQPGLGTTMMRSFGLTTTSDVGENHALIKQVWARIKKSHEVRNRTTFPDFLTAGLAHSLPCLGVSHFHWPISEHAQSVPELQRGTRIKSRLKSLTS